METILSCLEAAMAKDHWSKTFPAAITVTNEKGVIVEMNDRSVQTYEKDGGAGLVGSNAITCHKGPSLEKIQKLYEDGATNVYTITKRGQKKLIYQAPYFRDGKFAGMVELSLPLPPELPHYDRDNPK
jgi:hypothetical protein